MEFSVHSIIIILILFILIIFTLLLFNVGRHTKSNIYLGFYFIGQMLVLINFNFPSPSSIVYSILQSIIYSWGALFYLFASSLLDINYKFRTKSLLHFLPTLFGAIFLYISTEPHLSQHLQTFAPFIFLKRKLFLDVLFNILIIGYNVATIVKYYDYRVKVKKNPRLKNNAQPIWLNIAIWGFVVACLLVQIGNQLNKTLPCETFNWAIVGISAFLIYFCILFYVAVSSRTLTEKFLEKEKYKNSNLSEPEAIRLITQLENHMDVDMPYVNPDLKMKDIADLLKTSERNLSQLVNEYKNQNFSDFINSYRIKYAMNLLSDPSKKEKTILWILFESGFSSKTTFNTTFKKVTGCTPVKYRKKNKKTGSRS